MFAEIRRGERTFGESGVWEQSSLFCLTVRIADEYTGSWKKRKKKRKLAKRARIDEVYALVRFVKRRDLRVTQQMERMVQEQYKKEEEKKREAIRRKEEIAAAKEVFVNFCLFMFVLIFSHHAKNSTLLFCCKNI